MKYYRIKKNADFQKVFKKGKKVYDNSITCIYRRSDKLKMGIAISKKYGKAVKRNRIKRLLRQAFYNTCESLQGNYSIILLPKISEEYTLHAFEESLNHIFARINKWERSDFTTKK